MLSMANIRKSKGQAISLMLFVLIAAMLLNLGLVLLVDYGKSFEDRAEQLNAPHASFLQAADITTEEQMTYLKNYPGVTETEKQSVIAGYGDYYVSGSKTPAIIVFANADAPQKMDAPSFVGDSSPLDSNGIYVPYMMKTVGGYELGDDYRINMTDTELHFTIAGFTEEITYGAMMINIYRFYVSDDMFAELSEKFPQHEGFLQSVRLNNNDSGVQLQLDYTKEFFYSENSDNTTSFFDAISFDMVRSARTFIPTIMSMIVIAFAVILLAVCLIVIRFRIINSIEEGMTNVGALKSVGYKNSQIISSIVLQFVSIAAVGGVLGIALAQFSIPIFAKILETQSAVIWEPGFNAVFAFAAFFLIIFSILLVTFAVARRIRKLHPLAALRSGLETHSFKKNRLPLNKSRGPLPFLLAVKQLLQNKKQAVTIVVIIALVSFASIVGISIYYNIGVETDTFTSVIVGEKPDAGLVLKDNNDTAPVLKRLLKRQDVRKAFGYDQVSLLAEDYDVEAFVAKDFSQLEGNMLIDGRYPKHKNEVALNGMLSEAIGKKIGDKIAIKQGGNQKEFLVTGIIQMMNNSGLNMIMTYDGLLSIQSDYEYSQIYIYLTEGTDVAAFIRSIKNAEGDIFGSTVNMSELIDSQFEVYGSIFAAVAAGLLIVTVLVVILVLYMVIKAMILRKRRELGIQKALGFTTLQLMTQIALNFTPMVLIGVAIGGLGGYFGFNPIFTLTVRSSGIMQVNMPSPAGWTIITCVALTVLAYLVSMLIAWRIRKISPYTLVNE